MTKKQEPNVAIESAQSIIDALPERSKYAVLSSLIGSISCSIVGTASTIVGQLEKHDLEFVSLSPLEVLHMMQEPDFRMDRLHTVRKLLRVRDNLMAQFLAVANDNARDSWSGTLDLMTQGNRPSRINTDRLTVALSTIGIDEDTAKMLASTAVVGEAAQAQRSAEQIAARRGAIEWLIEKVFMTNEYYNELGQPAIDTSTEDDVESLPAQIVERLYEKLHVAVSKARDTAVTNYATSSFDVTLDDVMLLSTLVKATSALKAHNIEEATV